MTNIIYQYKHIVTSNMKDLPCYMLPLIWLQTL